MKRRYDRRAGVNWFILLLSTVVVFVLIGCEKKPVPIEPAAQPREKPPIEKPPMEKLPAETVKVVLSSTLAGSWYPADASALREQISGFFQIAEVKPNDKTIALILPHAGYQFSGPTAACGVKAAGGKYKRIVIIGPSHLFYMEEMMAVPRATHYTTPLGEVPLDVEFIEKLLAYPEFVEATHAHEKEHSVQIEVPLLQYARSDFKLVPIIASPCSPEKVEKVASILRGLIDNETLVIASSDFVHYGPRYEYVPFTENVPEGIKKLDMGAYEFIKALDGKGFLEYRSRTGATICGYMPIAILLSMMDKTAKAELMKYTTSGEVTGDYSNSVSYLAVAFSGTWGEMPQVKPDTRSELTPEDKERLLALARRSIDYALQHRQVPQEENLDIKISEQMKVVGAAFVTLRKNGQLRGCIGDIFPRQPLYKSVIGNAINAGFNDRRFMPVTADECNEITIEISALTVPEAIGSPDEIRLGIDGVVLNKDGRSAVFLPQVATEQGWDVSEMLANLSLKAGLPVDAWKDGAQFLVFQAVIFGETER
jgi:hypothetical protein